MSGNSYQMVVDDKYVLSQILGEGTYGIVYKATGKSNNKTYAIKKIKIEDTDEGIPSTTLREINSLKELDHPNIVKLLDVVYNSV
jgi:serine/threonine protein kinase